MDFIHRVRTFKRNLDENDDPSASWYQRKKILVCYGGFIGVILIGVLIFLLAGSHFEDNPTSEPRIILPLQWEGICPKAAPVCPKSFLGIPPTILVSLDAFHPELMRRGFTPTIQKIADCGAHAQYMVPVFPSKTFPNHFSQVTGVYPTIHGIIDNNFYDPVKHKMFKVGQSDMNDESWWLSEPIWITAEKFGKKTACYYWPGSEVKFKGVLPTYFKKYDWKKSFDSRVDQILSWLDLPPKSRPVLLNLYVNEPDHTLHRYGRDAKQVEESLVKVDRMIERLFAGLQTRDLLNCVNVIIMSDHGMANINCNKLINLQNFFDVNSAFVNVGPFARIRPKGRKNATAIQELISKLRCEDSHMRVYEKENLPVRYHYSHNDRIEPIFADIDSGWTVVSRNPTDDKGICTGGAHGYDNLFPDMRASFIAHGPSFKKNLTMEPFINVEVYEMIAELIDVPANPNNGTKGSLHYILKSPQKLLPQKNYESPPIADIPSEDSEYNNRVSASHCSCPQRKRQEQVQDIVTTQNLHLPFGTPYSPDEHSSLRLLYNEDYITAFHTKYRIPLWTAFTIKEPVNYAKVLVNCWTGDARVSAIETIKCDDLTADEKEKYILSPLYPPGFSSPSDGSSYITNSIAKSLNYSKIIDEPLNLMLKGWVPEKNGELNIVTGPAYNILYNGVKPSKQDLKKLYEKNATLQFPTHIFAVITWCSVRADSLKFCDPSKLLSHGFLLPNFPFPLNCEESPANILIKNSARVVDIEKLTGLHLYTGLHIYDAISLRTMIPRSIT